MSKLSSWIIVGGVIGGILGCQKPAEIRTYVVPKSKTASANILPASTEPTHRMLGAMLPNVDKVWFFKLLGPVSVVAEYESTFRSLVESVTFGDENQPNWSLPQGWRRLPGEKMRFATLQIPVPGGEPLETTVIGLPKMANFVASNLNRWRGQLGLSEISPTDAAQATETVELQSGTATLVDISGTTNAGSQTPPFTRSSRSSAPSSFAAENSPVAFEVPNGWEPGRMSAMRKAAFVARNSGQQVEITIIDLSRSAGDLLSNVNRWRGEIGLEEVGGDALAAMVNDITVDSHSGHYVRIVSDDQEQSRATYVAVVPRRDKTWFIKLTGDASVAEREATRFSDFVQSIRFQ